MSDLSKILAENQKEMLKLIAPLSKKRPIRLEDHDNDFEPEKISVARMSTPVITTTTANSKTTPVNSRNNFNVDVFQIFQPISRKSKLKSPEGRFLNHSTVYQ